MTPDQKLDHLYGKMNALEVVTEEVLAELLRSAKSPDEALDRVSKVANRRVEEMKQRGQLPLEVRASTEDNVKRIVLNLSIAIQGSVKPRNPGI
jgi:hypothetical protein